MSGISFEENAFEVHASLSFLRNLIDYKNVQSELFSIENVKKENPIKINNEQENIEISYLAHISV